MIKSNFIKIKKGNIFNDLLKGLNAFKVVKKKCHRHRDAVIEP